MSDDLLVIDHGGGWAAEWAQHTIAIRYFDPTASRQAATRWLSAWQPWGCFGLALPDVPLL